MCDVSPFEETKDCQCRQAVERCYKTLVCSGEPASAALHMAKRVYRHHHPEIPKIEGGVIVERWVSAVH